MRLRVPALLAIATALGLAGTARAQTGATGRTFTVTGTVRTGSGQGIEAAQVYVVGTHSGALADTAGRFRIRVPADSVTIPFTVRAQLIGFETVDRTVAKLRADSAVVDFVLPFKELLLGGWSEPAKAPEPVCTLPGSGDSGPAPYAEFSWRLFREMAAESPHGNVTISPVSAASALAIVFEGARGGTAEAFGAVLGAGPGDARALAERTGTWRRSMLAQDCVDLIIANSIWLDPDIPFDSTFVARSVAVHDALTGSLGRGAAGRINAWAEEKTRGRIGNVASEPVREDLLVLDAVYFRGLWAEPFDTLQTRIRAFHPESGDSLPLQMMSRTFTTRYAERTGYRMARLPYRGGRFAMYVLLPDSGSLPADLLDRLGPDSIAAAISNAGSAHLRLVLPRIRLRDGYDLRPPLEGLGLGLAFDSVHADLSGLVRPDWLGTRKVYVSRARQAVFFELDEEGTEAAAVTTASIVVTGSASPLHAVPFVVDRPFILLIRDDETGALLFIGQVMHPV